MRKTALIYLPVYALLMAVGREFIVFLYTRNYAASWRFFAVNLTMLLLLIVLTDPVIRAYAEHRYFVVRVRAVIIGAQIITLWFAIHRLGPIGAIVTLVGMSILERSIVARRTAQILGMRRADLRLFAGILKIGLLAAGCAVLTYLLRNLIGGAHPFAVLALCGPAFGLLFVAGLFLFGLLEAEERELIHRQVARFRHAGPLARSQAGGR
jgi:hypothetical protein